MLYYDCHFNNAYIFYSCKNLPANGWFQQCLVCDIITAQKELFTSKNEIDIYYFRCSTCKKKILPIVERRKMYKWLDNQCLKYSYKYE